MKPTRPTASPAPSGDRPRRPVKTPGGQSGYTLIEMVMVIAILGLLSVAVNQAIAHAIRIGGRGTESMTAITQIENTFRWANIDVQQSQAIEPEAGNGFPLTLSWVEWDGTIHAVVYSVDAGEMTRSVYINDVPEEQMTIARYLDPDAAVTNCRLTGRGNFSLTDSGDSFTITGGQPSSSGQIVVSVGGISVSTTGTATYNAGLWSTPAAGDEVIVTATAAGTRGIWTSENTGASLALTYDGDGDAVLRGSALKLTLTAFGGENTSYSDTRQVMIFSRS